MGINMKIALMLLLSLSAPAHAKSPEHSVMLVGWDGADRRRLHPLLEAGRLPNLALLISSGSLVDTLVTTGETVTKSGWSEILTGRSADAMGIEGNRVYRPIPPGATVFEHWKKAYGRKVCAVFVGAKINNIGMRGPHEICINCQNRDDKTRVKTAWWDRESNVGKTPMGLPTRWVSREGEPFHNAQKVLDFVTLSLGPADKVGPEALKALEFCGKKPFFAFFHFEDPDEVGHVLGEYSPEHLDAFVAVDKWLGQLVSALESSGRRASTAIVVTTDHGMDWGGKDHQHAPLTWLASDRPGLRAGDRKDAGATLFELLELKPGPIAGKPLTAH